MGFGVPAEWLADVRLATEDTLLTLADHLPAEAAEALLELATGGQPRKPEPATATADPFEHPDAQRRFRVVADIEELERALEFPWDRWTVFLHPAQRELVERKFGGPARISGSAGTGKTVVALHRAVHLARTNPDARVLLTTFSDTLANSLRIKLGRLSGTEPRLRERIDVEAVDTVAHRLHDRMEGPVTVASPDLVRDIVGEAAARQADQKFALSFLTSEWNEVVDAWQLDTWDAYRDVARLGRKTRLPEKQRQLLWVIFEQVRSELGKRKVLTPAQRYYRLVARLARDGRSPYDFIVVDEAQDLSVAQLRFLATLGAGREDALFFAGDLGQRIFQIPFSWRSLGVDIRGRSTTLRVNYRTSHQIRAQADRLLGAIVTDVDGNIEERGATISVFNGAEPTVQVLQDADQECELVTGWLKERVKEGVLPGEIAVFVRSPDEMPRAEAAVQAAGLSACTARRTSADGTRPRRSRDHAPEQGAGIPLGSRDGLRRRGASAPIPHRSRDGRRGSRGCVRDGAALALCRLYSRARSPTCHWSGAGVGVLGGFAEVRDAVWRLRHTAHTRHAHALTRSLALRPRSMLAQRALKWPVHSLTITLTSQLAMSPAADAA